MPSIESQRVTKLGLVNTANTAHYWRFALFEAAPVGERLISECQMTGFEEGIGMPH
jgi:hypothetical protein